MDKTITFKSIGGEDFSIDIGDLKSIVNEEDCIFKFELIFDERKIEYSLSIN